MQKTEKQTVAAALRRALRGAAIFNTEVQAAPYCILWPDKDRQWEAVIPMRGIRGRTSAVFKDVPRILGLF